MRGLETYLPENTDQVLASGGLSTVPESAFLSRLKSIRNLSPREQAKDPLALQQSSSTILKVHNTNKK